VTFKARIGAALALLASASCVVAQESSSSRFSFQGYGTLGLVHSSEDQADYRGSLLRLNGVGYTRSWSLEIDSRVGAQAIATLTPKLSAILQLVAEQRSDGSYAPRIEWANLKYEFTPDASMRIGRIVIPSFLVSDSRKVGYANAWIRPPAEVYALVPVTANDGIDASYRIRTGGFSHTVQALFGQSTTDLPDGGDAEAKRVWGVTASSERGPLTARVAYLQTDLTIERFNTLFDAFRAFGPEGIAIAERFDADGSLFQFYGLGAQYDPGDWFVMAEGGRIRSHAAVSDRTAWYVSGGYRFGKLTPFLIYSTVDPDVPLSHPGLTVSAYPPALAGVATALNAGLNDILSGNPSQDTFSIGARWDFAQNLDLKLQVDHSRLGPGSAGSLGNIQPGFEPGGSYTLVSIAVDIVF
jgi:hypothetical protein